MGLARLAARLLTIFFGYCVAVFVAVLVTVLLHFLPALAYDGNPLAAQYGSESSVLGAVMLGIFITAPTALPGFAATLAVARARNASSLTFFAIAGMVDAFIASAILGFFLAAGVLGALAMLGSTFTLLCLPGGLAGGLAYGLLVGRATAARPKLAAA